MQKHEIRKHFIKKRSSLSTEEVNEFNSKIHSLFEQFLPKEVKTVHIYIPIQSKAEIDTWPIIHELWAKNIRVVAPIMDVHKNTLSSWQLTKETRLEKNSWNVPEPVQSTKANNKEIDAIVIPLLAFDKDGYRVGYGKGYYDRFLASIDKKILKIGLSFFPPIDRIDDLDSYDVPLNYCITPEKIIHF